MDNDTPVSPERLADTDTAWASAVIVDMSVADRRTSALVAVIPVEPSM